MQHSDAPVSIRACCPVIAGFGGGMATTGFGRKSGSNPISTWTVGPYVTSRPEPETPADGSSTKPQWVSGMLWCVHHRCWQRYWRSTNLPYKIGTTSESLDGLFGCRFERSEKSDELPLPDQHPLTHVVGFQVASQRIICCDLFVDRHFHNHD
jgi:hypothetical protein